MGFTRKELAVLTFLVVSFLAGLGVWMFRSRFAPLPEVEAPFLVDAVDSDSLNAQPDPSHIGMVDPAPRNEQVGTVRNLDDLNRASPEVVETLPGIGPVLAERIVQYRKENGGFDSVDDLMNVKGIGPKTLARIKTILNLTH